MEQTRLTIYLIKYNVLKPEEDFAKIVSKISNIPDFELNQVDNKITVKIKDKNSNFEFSVTSFKTGLEKENQAAFLLNLGVSDSDVMDLFRHLARDFGYRMYEPELGSFLPINPDMVLVKQLIPDENIAKVYRAKKFQPLYVRRRLHTQYAISELDKGVYILNSGMSEYFAQYGVDTSNTPEFSYKVADNPQMFTALFDSELIPLSFYRHFRKSQKIINYSFMDIMNVRRKVFVKPYFYVYKKEKQTFEALTSDKSALSYADKIRPGEDLDKTITRIVKVEMKFSDSYYRAKVDGFISFDRDRNNKLTPLLSVYVYLLDINLNPEKKKESQRGWQSINKQVN
ncbi:hypothetical protein ACFL1A_01205 [Patescibacteria group bacterium]